MPDFVTVLTEDHRRVEQLFKEFDQWADRAVALEVCMDLTVHALVEEELLYGLYAEVDDARAADARAQHEEARSLIADIRSLEPGSDDLVTTMTKLKTTVLHHIDVEEQRIFPELQERIPDAGRLGDRMAARKAQVEVQVRAEAGMTSL